jgi:hypothetical protein
MQQCQDKVLFCFEGTEERGLIYEIKNCCSKKGSPQ